MKKTNFFWVSFSDLMVSLFFVMLVLFAVAIGFSESERRKAEDAREASEQQLKKIQEIQESTKQLPEEYFSYQPQYKRFKLNKQIQFQRGKSEIESQYKPYLIEVGKSIQSLIERLKSNERSSNFEIKYLVVIEGMASNDNYPLNFELSYNRALSLYRLWKEEPIIFDPEICEVQIAGSGTEGLREYAGFEEYKNQQFLIHIVPKIGRIIE
ncbi:OmpA family protein [Algoriphagus faecimaris]|uniref:OmpA family protein n=1 Tax=Algoriphagus faecimaris TaxID=686796 RepID=A0A1G6WI88_9BACT|nr:OmpA family protein [Algoriphagus faecimaris]SDD64947.1 OmpA family protein [Algoriphagus faecimaris]